MLTALCCCCFSISAQSAFQCYLFRLCDFGLCRYQTPEMLRVPLDELCLQIKLLDLGDVAGTSSETYGSIITVVLHINGVPCFW